MPIARSLSEMGSQAGGAGRRPDDGAPSSRSASQSTIYHSSRSSLLFESGRSVVSDDGGGNDDGLPGDSPRDPFGENGGGDGDRGGAVQFRSSSRDALDRLPRASDLAHPASNYPSPAGGEHPFHYPGDESSFEDIGRFRQRCGEIVDDERVQLFVLVLIAVNSIMIGMATFPYVKDDPVKSNAFEVVDMVVLVIFTVESLVQFIFHGSRRFFKDGWLVFDFTIVIISWVSVEADALKSFRVLRALRFVTQVAILRNIVVAILSIVPSIAAIFTLLMLIFYIFGVMFTTLFKDFYKLGYTEVDYFGRMDYTLFTLFQFLCLDEWSGVAYEVVAVHYWAWVIFIAFIVMSAFVTINLLIAVICDALQILRNAEETMLEQNLYGGLDAPSMAAGGGEEATIAGNDDGGRHGGAGEDASTDERARLRRTVDEMQTMLDEMIAAQESMARTIRYLTLALYAERKPERLGSIREAMEANGSWGSGARRDAASDDDGSDDGGES